MNENCCLCKCFIRAQLALQIWRLSKVRTGLPKRWFGKFVRGFAKSRPQLIVLNIDWVQVVVKNCEILHSVRGLYDKQASDVLYKKYKRLIYTPPDLLARFCKVNLSKAKNSTWFVFQEFFSRPNLLWSRVIMALECDRRWLLFFRCTYKAINSMLDVSWL